MAPPRPEADGARGAALVLDAAKKLVDAVRHPRRGAPALQQVDAALGVGNSAPEAVASDVVGEAGHAAVAHPVRLEAQGDLRVGPAEARVLGEALGWRDADLEEVLVGGVGYGLLYLVAAGASD